MRAIFYKEWLKLRSWLGLLLLGNVAVSAWVFLSIRHRFRTEHAEMIFYQVSQIGRLLHDDLRHVPLITGLALAAAQFAPEVAKRRLRLSFHLPIGLAPMILAHLAFGLAALAVILALDAAALAAAVGTFFPAAFVTDALVTALPWLLAGVAGYLGVALVFLEPQPVHRAVNAAVAAGVIWTLHLSTRHGAYAEAIWGHLLLVALMVPAVLLPVSRFRDGGR